VRGGLRARDAEGKPVQIGRLQRYATDVAMAAGKQFYKRAAPTGKKVAVVGAGPAGLAARTGWRCTATT
jgi:dihydropyrimidine dehydrogenase (NAD+) subunit PreT